MSRISLVSAANTLVRILPSTIRNIDLRVAGCVAVALGCLGGLAYLSLRGYPLNPFALPESKPNYGFSEEMLNRTIVINCGFKDASNRPATIQSTFRQVCESVCRHVDEIIERDDPPGSNAIPSINVISASDDTVDGTSPSFYRSIMPESSIAVYLDYGLPEGSSYITASDEVKQQSWVHQILQKLRDQGQIKTFKFDDARMLKITK